MNDSSAEPDDSASLLAVREWFAVALIGGLLLLLTFFSVSGWQNVSLGKKVDLKSSSLDVFVEGAVAFPGLYRVEPGTSSLDLIAQAAPLPSADLRRFKVTSKVRNRQRIVVAVKPMILVKLVWDKNVVEKIFVPKGTRVAALKNYIPPRAVVDFAKLQQKRFLRDKEKIILPLKESP